MSESEEFDSESDSDYCVEEFICPDKTRKSNNNDSADLLGNFDDEKRKQIMDGTYLENPASDGNEESSDDNDEEMKSDDENEANLDEVNTKLSKEQMDSLLKGASKTNRYVLYVTNLNFQTTRDDLINLFSSAGEVKNVRIPKNRRGGFAFVEMVTFKGFQTAFEFHNTMLNEWPIKIQISEGGKKKSANKKNILKQKNRKLAEMRNEQKTFTKSGKNYDKNIKKEKEKEAVARKRWRKPQTKLMK